MTTPRRLEFREVKRAEIDRIWTIDRREHIANDYRLVGGALHFDPVATVLNIERCSMERTSAYRRWLRSAR